MTRIPSAPVAPETSAKTWSLGTFPWQERTHTAAPRARVIIDNDFSGDPDDLYQIVHHVLSPGAEIRYVIASHLRPGDPFDPGPYSAENAERVALDVFGRMGLASTDVIVRGSNDALADAHTPQPAPAVDAIIREALRDDVTTPLFYAAGAGLTDLASALLIEPSIASRITLVWIGGNEHEGLAYAPPNPMPIEYNLLIDVTAAQVVFNDFDIEIWQVPRDRYRQCLVSDAELRHRVRPHGALGQYLFDEIEEVNQRATEQGRGPGETYALGDQPLVLFTSLLSLFEADPSSSTYVRMPTPTLNADGTYTARPGARPLRVYTNIDTRLMFEDFYLKLAEFTAWQQH
ncbi:nucleoside hydrolase [Micrococcales bacterium 31B]|nr:nucleoside hydrolase [Micrococcales bacterium 31B]